MYKEQTNRHARHSFRNNIKFTSIHILVLWNVNRLAMYVKGNRLAKITKMLFDRWASLNKQRSWCVHFNHLGSLHIMYVQQNAQHFINKHIKLRGVQISV